MTAVFACNAYVDTMAPWALRKTDPERMAAVLGTLVVAIRQLTVAVAPIIPASADKLLSLIDAGEGGAPIAAADAAVPAARARGGSGGVRLIDSHCHLNYEGLAERQDEVLDNARARGVQGFLNISTRQKEWGDVIARRRARMPTSGPASGSIPTKRTPIPTSARRRWSRAPGTRA